MSEFLPSVLRGSTAAAAARTSDDVFFDSGFDSTAVTCVSIFYVIFDASYIERFSISIVSAF